MINDIIAYESGELNDEETLDLFQRLVDNGMAWTLQGHYGRAAAELIEARMITDTHNVLGLDLGPIDCE